MQAPPWPLYRLVESLAAGLPRLQAALLPPHLHAMLLATAFFQSKALHAVTALGVADGLEGGPLAIAELATRLGVKEDALGHVLRAVAAHGIFQEAVPRQGVGGRAGEGGAGPPALHQLLGDTHPTPALAPPLQVSSGVFSNNLGSSVLRSSHPNSLNSMIKTWGEVGWG